MPLKLDITIKIKDATPADVEQIKQALQALQDQPTEAETVKPN